MAPTDIVERAVIAVVAALEANADIQTITGRSGDNSTAWDVEAETPTPVIAYRYTIATPGGGAIGDTREIMFLFSAIAPTESVANALLEAVENIRWSVVLAAQNPPLDGYMRNPVRRSVGWDTDADATREDLEYTLVVTK
jgi:hypothetical protein